MEQDDYETFLRTSATLFDKLKTLLQLTSPGIVEDLQKRVKLA
jgi:hypothetical protein